MNFIQFDDSTNVLNLDHVVSAVDLNSVLTLTLSTGATMQLSGPNRTRVLGYMRYHGRRNRDLADEQGGTSWSES